MKQILFPLVAAALISSGCASIVSGSNKTVQINATPESNISIVNGNGSGVASGKTKMSVELPTGSGYFKAQGYQVKVSQAGYRTKTVDILPSFNPWYLGNFLLPFVGTIGGLIVDPNTGAFYTLSPTQIDLELEPTGVDIALLNRENSAIQRARGFRVSKHDYTAAQRAKELGCTQLASPEVKDIGSARETLTYECRSGQTLAVVCLSGGDCQ